MSQPKQKFVVTAAVSAKMVTSTDMDRAVKAAIDKFIHNEWGTCSANDSAMNNLDIMSAMGNYPSPEGVIWVKSDDYGEFRLITVLFPSDY